jgi:hypothetical protein
MPVNFGSTIKLVNNGTYYIEINYLGFFNPTQPSLHVASGHGAGAGDIVPATALQFNVGSHYNTSNGRFTAPVAGVYFFRFHQLAPYVNTGEYRTAIYMNGAAYGGSRFINHKSLQTWRCLFTSGFVNMAVNDYVTIRYESGPAALYTDSNYAALGALFLG